MAINIALGTLGLSGTPAGVPLDADCAIRALAWEYGKHLLPERGEFRTLFDALQLSGCNMTAPSATDAFMPPNLPTPTSNRLIYVATDGSDEDHDGSLANPFATLAHAVAMAAAPYPKPTSILVRGGSYHLPEPLVLTSAHSGLRLANYAGEHVRVSGGVAFKIPKSAWTPFKQHVRWETYDGVTDVYGQVDAASDAEGIAYLGDVRSASACEAAASNFTAWTYFDASAGGGFRRNCFGRTDAAWAPVPQAHATSGLLVQQNVWHASATHVDGLGEGMPGLRLDGKRLIRAKYPNGDPEASGDFLRGANLVGGGGDYVKGWIPLAANTEWVPPRRKPDAVELVVTAADWPGVEWPMSELGGGEGADPWTGEGDWGEYHLGLGGYCDDLEPPVGYWCSMNPPRGQCWDAKTNLGTGCVQTHMSPEGIVLPRAANWTHPEDAVVQSWRGGGRWFTQQWRATGFVRENQTLMFDPSTGMQGGEGMTDSGQWWVENVLEECDDAREFYYDRRTAMLYYNPNSTSEGPTGEEAWVATQRRVLINISGTMADPVQDVTISGLSFADARDTYFDKHGMPSGGDWALQRTGAITAEGTERLTISFNELVNLDGVGISLNGYHRNATIERNDILFLGETAMAAWGHTGTCLNQNCSKAVPHGYKVGPDARGGEQPHGTLVRGNLVRELGLYQKQSSMWFQATTQQTRLVGNVHFNGPRAGINFNDQMGGGDVIEGNLLANCVRESGDHGPFNSWDRVPYITTLRTGQPSIIPAWRDIRNNFFLATYSSQAAIDNDDGSSYYRTEENFFPYAAYGLKSDYAGQYNWQQRNVYAYVTSAFWVGRSWLSGNSDRFVNNTIIANSATGGFPSDCNRTGCSWDKADTTPCIPPLMIISGNEIYNEYGKLPSTDVCDASNRVVGQWPSPNMIVAMGRAVLKLPGHALAAAAADVVATADVAAATVTQYGPSARAIALQEKIDESIVLGASVLSIPAGDYYFGNVSLVIHRASNFTLRAESGPGTVQMWFCIGAGLLVNQSSDVVLDGFVVDYDPPAHYQGTIVEIADDTSSNTWQALVQTDSGFLDPAVFDAAYHLGIPGVQAGPDALVWNASDPGFGAFTSASWPPTATAEGKHMFSLQRKAFCEDIQYTTTDGSSCLIGHASRPQARDKITAHIRTGFTLHVLNSSRVHTQHVTVHGAPGFAITEYDGYGQHSYLNVSVGRRQVSAGRRPPDGAAREDSEAKCGLTNPTGGRLCLGLIASNNDALHSSGCKHGPTFTAGELSYCLDDWVNVHSRAQVVMERVDARHVVLVDPRLVSAASVPDNFAYGNAETLTNAKPGDMISFFLSGNLSSLGSARVLSTRRATWTHDSQTVEQAQQLLEQVYNTTCGLDAGLLCRQFGCEPRVWHVEFDSEIPRWADAASARGIVASLDSWTASGARVKDSHLHHGRFGIRWKSSDASISGSRISARYMEISPLEFYMEGPLRLTNISVVGNTFPECAAPAASFAKTECTEDTHIPLGYWCQWVEWGGGCGGVCHAAAVGASQLDAQACTAIAIDHNNQAH